MTRAQEQVSNRLRETMLRRLAGLLQIEEKQFVEVAGSLSLAELLNGIVLVEGQSAAIGSYFGTLRFLGELVGRDELFRRPESKQLELEPEQIGVAN